MYSNVWLRSVVVCLVKLQLQYWYECNRKRLDQKGNRDPTAAGTKYCLFIKVQVCLQRIYPGSSVHELHSTEPNRFTFRPIKSESEKKYLIRSYKFQAELNRLGWIRTLFQKFLLFEISRQLIIRW